MINQPIHHNLPESKAILDSALPAALIIPVAPRESYQTARGSNRSDRATRSVACPRATSELNRHEITWERIDKVSKSLPNALTMMFSMGD